MGSVIDYVDCPNCGQEAFSDFYWKSGEEYVSCGSCGYYKSITIKKESRSKRLDELQESDWQVNEVRNPYGSYRVRIKGNVAYQSGPITDKEEYDEIVSNIKNVENVELFTISRFIDGKIVVEKIV